MVYTVCIGSNERRRQNLEFARKRLLNLFPGIRFSQEVDTRPYRLSRSVLFANQIACFESEMHLPEVIACLKNIEREAGSTPQERAEEIIRLDVDLLSCDGKVYKRDDWERGYVKDGLKELNINVGNNQ